MTVGKVIVAIVVAAALISGVRAAGQRTEPPATYTSPPVVIYTAPCGLQDRVDGRC